ncbi:MAG: hypothetical protein IH881_16320 [Myxococcales bacterium]|nr:hypothetical protein [Myxococcales bacterium]
MTTEVALIESDQNQGVRLLGRTSAPEVIGLVRDHLINRLDSESAEKPATPGVISDREEPRADQE